MSIDFNQLKLKTSNLLTDNKIWLQLERFTGEEIDMDIFHETATEIEEIIAEKFIQAIEDTKELPKFCGFCGEEVELARYCSYECNKADNTEGV